MISTMRSLLSGAILSGTPLLYATVAELIGERARLTLRVDTEKAVTTALPIQDPRHIVTKAPFELRMLRGFSPYTAGNAAEPTRAVVFEWRKELSLELAP